jgi:tetratricopeptide (TPR) repeat protein
METMNTSKNTKSILYLVLAVLIIFGIVYTATHYKNKDAANLSLSEINKLNEKQRIEALEAQVKDLQNQAQSLASDAADETKYGLYIKLAEAQLELGKNQEAVDTLNKIPADKQTNSRTAIAFIRAYKGVGDNAKAKEMAAKNLLLYDEVPEIWVAYLDLNQDLPVDQLKALYAKAIPATKSNVDVMISYAHFSEKIGDKANAIAAWETARNVDPNNAAQYESEMARLKQ